MGDRAVIYITPAKDTPKGTPVVRVYTHWDGSPERVLAVADFIRAHVRADDIYGPARLIQAWGNAIGGNLSLGVEAAAFDLSDEGAGDDNGAYQFSAATNEIVAWGRGDLDLPTLRASEEYRFFVARLAKGNAGDQGLATLEPR